MGEEVGGDTLGLQSMKAGEPVADTFLAGPGQDTINLGAVAGGQDGALAEGGVRGQAVQGTGQDIRAKRDAFADIHRGSFVVESDGQ